MLSEQASSRKDPDSQREVFRSAGSAVLSWAWFVVAVIIGVDLAVQGRDRPALVTAVLVLAITGIVYGCAWRPKIVADRTGITIVNPVRDHQVPWAAVTKVDVVNAVRVHCAAPAGASRGKVLCSWAVQSSPRSARRAALRREAAAHGRSRLTPRPRSLEPPPGAVPRYGELPEPAREALNRSSAEFTAGRLAERAQHAQQAGRAAQSPAAEQAEVTGAQRPGDALGAGAFDLPGTGADGAAGNGQAGVAGVASAPATPGPAAPALGVPVAQWAWLSIAAMLVPLALLLVVIFV